MENLAKIILASNNEIVQKGLAHWLGQFPELILARQVRSGAELESTLLDIWADAIILDLPHLNEVTQKIKRRQPLCQVLVLNSASALEEADLIYNNQGNLHQQLKYLLAQDNSEQKEFKLTIKSNPTWQKLKSQITKREQEVLQLLSVGLEIPEISHQLHLSQKTVKTYISRIIQKLNTKSRWQAVAIAFRGGLVS